MMATKGEQPKGQPRGADGYDPFEHRNLEHPTNEVESVMHLVKGSLGSGILGMPKAFQNGGLWLSLGLTPIVALLCGHGIHMVVSSAHELYYREKIPMLDFSEVAELAFRTGPPKARGFGGVAKHSINWLMSINLLGTCCIYLVFIASNMKQIVEFHGYTPMDLRLYILCLWPLVMCLIMVRNLKYLAPVSALANLLILVGMCICFYYMLSDIPSPRTRVPVGSLSTVPLFFSTVIFALEGIGVVMPLENNMKNSLRFIGFPSVLSTGVSIVLFMYMSVGFCGYLKYGPTTSDAITLNLPVEEPLAQSVKIIMSIAILLTYFLQFYVPLRIIQKAVESRWGEISYTQEIIMRIAFSSATVGVAVAVPTLEIFMSLVGALCLASLGLVLPPAMDTAIRWQTDGALGPLNWRLFKNGAIALIGLTAMIIGTYSSLDRLVEFYREGNPEQMELMEISTHKT